MQRYKYRRWKCIRILHSQSTEYIFYKQIIIVVTQMGYTALVTGANRGIGLGLVEELASKSDVEIIFAATRHPDAPALIKLREKYDGKVHPVEMEVVDEKSVAVVYPFQSN
jgi:NADP-dependent 3-hydroxy acid dehydrogenase YdfG